MGIKLTVSRRFKINGKEFNSVEEMPPDLRSAFEKALAARNGPGGKLNFEIQRARIVFNGREYKGIDAMPRDVRQAYEKVLKAAETGELPPDILAAGGRSAGPTESGANGPTRIRNMEATAGIEPAFSPRKLIAGLILIALILLLYFAFLSR